MLFHAHDHSAGFSLGDLFLHSLTDTAKMLPFLFLAYLVIEYIERKQSGRVERILAKGGRFGFIPGALLGIIPQCGFSAMAANFYASRVVSLSTLIAVFLATSDEAIPIMLANPSSYGSLAMLVGAKIVWALGAGLLIEFVLSRLLPVSLRGGYGGSTQDVDCHDHHEKDRLLPAALRHTANIYVFVLLFTFAFGFLVEWLGEDNISHFLGSLGFFQPIIAGLVGLIPNCASSVLLTQLFMQGTISFGSVFAGLSVNAGIGLTVLFKANKNLKQNLFILGLLYLFGVLPGIVLHLLGL